MGWRPTYETPADLAREKAVAEFLAQLWGDCRFGKLNPQPFRLDWWFDCKPVPRAVEIKCRTALPGRGVLIDVSKLMAADDIERSARFEPSLVTKFADDSLWIIRTKNIVREPVLFCGRGDRNDPYDVGPCVAIPLERMTLLREATAPAQCS